METPKRKPRTERGRHGSPRHRGKGNAKQRSAPGTTPWWKTKQALGGGAALLAAVVVVALFAALGGGSPGSKGHHPSGSSPTSPTSPTAALGPLCPLTGTRAPGGKVPHRSALAVKVGNYPAGRPQSGLAAADVVFEEPVEGGITRFVAVFQCHGAAAVGPVRSARNIDIGILGQLGRPLIVHVGGIQPVIDNIQASPLEDFELGDYSTAVDFHPTGRVAPYDTYTSPTLVWRMRTTANIAPQPLFSYSKAVPTGAAVHSVSVPFSSYSPVVWTYDPKLGQFLRFYNATRALLANGTQMSATNVVIQFVHVTYGPWLENTEGGLEVQANLSTHASGQAIVLRNGVEIRGHWSRTSLGQATSFTTDAGAPIALAPGKTWVELVPTTVKVTATHA